MSELLPCPFCGAPAEWDTSRGYRMMSSGQLGKSVAVYCTVCPADMTWCREDFRGIDSDDLMAMLFEKWNQRAVASAPAEDELEPVPDGCGGSGIIGGWDAKTGMFFDTACPGCADCGSDPL